MANKAANYINHIALVLDASGSMQYLAQDVVKVADNQIAYLAQRSNELDQETRTLTLIGGGCIGWASGAFFDHTTVQPIDIMFLCIVLAIVCFVIGSE